MPGTVVTPEVLPPSPVDEAKKKKARVKVVRAREVILAKATVDGIVEHNEASKGRGGVAYAGRATNKLARIIVSETGCSIRTLARIFDVNSNTFGSWVRRFPKLARAIQRGRDEYASVHVEGALLKRARGYTVVETEYRESDNDKNGRTTAMKRTIRHIAPDTQAIIFYLTNRQRKRWKNVSTKQVEADVNLRGQLKHGVIDNTMSQQEAAAAYAGLIKG